MKCDHCDKPAVVHEVVIRNNTTREVHLCAEHAAERGYQVPAAPVTQLLAQFAGQIPSLQAAARRDPATPTRCAGCGLTFAEFRQSGVLGCPGCYDAFMPQIGTVIERAQGGAVHHVGRAPRHLEGMADRVAMRARLLQELDAAVAAEQYERAARLRDQLQELGEAAPEGGAA
ncbi:MAG: UvrB/UvrC motif-containing protein [Phycisphaerales bacterium]|jgi:protein arginine kinase activator